VRKRNGAAGDKVRVEVNPKNAVEKGKPVKPSLSRHLDGCE